MFLFGKVPAQFVAPKELMYNVDSDTAWKRVRRLLNEEAAHPNILSSRWKTLEADLNSGEIRLQLMLSTQEKLGGSIDARYKMLTQMDNGDSINTELVMDIRLNLLVSGSGNSTKFTFEWRGPAYEGKVNEKAPQAHFDKVQQHFYAQLNSLMK